MNTVFPWLTSNTHIDYPFTARRADGLHELFVDAYVIHTKFRNKDSLLKITSFNPTGVLTLKFADDVVLETLTSFDGFISKVFGAYTLYEWRKSTITGGGLTGENIIARLTVLTSKLAAHVFPVSPVDAFLQPALVVPSINRIRRFGTSVNGVPCCIGISDKEVIFQAGNNISLQQTAEQAVLKLESETLQQASRTPKTIAINAVPGEGTGRFNTCTSLASEIRSLGGVGGDDNGNFYLDFRDCLWSEFRLDGATSPPIHPNTDYLADLEKSLLQLHANCKACCDCADYGATYAQIKEVFDRAKNAAERGEKVRVRYNELALEVNALIAEREVGLALDLRITVGPDFSLGLLGTVGNSSISEESGVSLRFTVSTIKAAYIAESGRMEAEGFHDVQTDPVVTVSGSSNRFTFSVPAIKPTKYARARFGVRISKIAGANRAGKQLTITLEAIKGGSTVAVKSAFVNLKGPLDKT